MLRSWINCFYPFHPSHDPLDCTEEEVATWYVIRRKCLKMLLHAFLGLAAFTALLILRHKFSLAILAYLVVILGYDAIRVHRYRLGSFGNRTLAYELHHDKATLDMINEEAREITREIQRQREKGRKQKNRAAATG